MAEAVTPKQARFCELVAGGMSKSESYRNAYDANGMADRSVRTEAHRLGLKPHIAEAIERLEEEDSAIRHTTDRLRNDWILQRLQDEAMNLRNPASARVRALEILARTQGMFTDVKHVEIHRSPAEIEEELLQKLGALNVPLSC